jgi:putative ABC transport system permease protein
MGIASVGRRRAQTVVVAVVVFLTSAVALLGVGLLVQSSAPFDRAFEDQLGAHAVAVFDGTRTTSAAVAATGTRPGVTAAAGPFADVKVALTAGTLALGDATLVGRDNPAGPVDQLTLDSGRWVRGPDEIVLSSDFAGAPGTDVGDRITANVTGSPSLVVVGHATSVTSSADGWVWPADANRLTTGSPDLFMLYRFASAGDDQAVRSSLADATAGLPDGALLGSGSYLTRKTAVSRATTVFVPFVVSFAVLGLVVSVLIVTSVVSGAVVAGLGRIGILKTLGFTPRQVVGVYALQVFVPSAIASVAGILLGNALAVPVLGGAANAYGLPRPGALPWWTDVIVLTGMPFLVAVAAVAPATRAGRFSPARAISVGRAPRAGHGYALRRWLARVPIPRAVSFGLASLAARPMRAVASTLAVLLGATTVVFAIGLATSVSRVGSGATRIDAVPVEVDQSEFGSRAGPDAVAHAAKVEGTVRSQTGTAHAVGVSTATVGIAGMTTPVRLTMYDGEASWVGYPLIDGRWYSGPDEVVVSSYLMRSASLRLGGTVTVVSGSVRREARVVGEAFDLTNGGLVLIGDQTMIGSGPAVPDYWEVALDPGTDPVAYVGALSVALQDLDAFPRVRSQEHAQRVFTILQELALLLASFLCAVAAVGVFNTVLLNTRERIHEIGILKTVGMTPRQVRTMIVVSVCGIGLIAGVIAIPLGLFMHQQVIQVMADAIGSDVPGVARSVYGTGELIALAVAGLGIAVLGALAPARWASRATVSAALRAE